MLPLKGPASGYSEGFLAIRCSQKPSKFHFSKYSLRLKNDLVL